MLVEDSIIDALNKGLISFEHPSLFGNKLGVSETQLISWKYFDGKFANITKMRLQHAILPCKICEYSIN
jgi:hypothetical protein